MNSLTKPLVSLLTLGGLALLAFAAPAAADERDSYGYVRVVEGSATLVQAGSDERSDAEINQPVLAGDRILVPGRSRVEIVLADRNVLRIDGGTELILERLAASPDRDDRASVVRLLEGNIQLTVVEESYGDELPRIETPSATVYVENYGIFRVTADRAGWSEVVVRRGSAQVVTERGSSRVRADEEAIIDGDRYARIEVREAGGFDALEKWARRLDDEYASADLRYVDDNLRYQAAPLARYGSWVTIEGGNYWRPRVAADWRPYWQGRWIYTPAGMTWVSYEPWGWVPYHYGSWDYFPSYGWVWAPGYRWAPAWVYWYWGASHVGWCPTGYYTRYYGSRWGGGSGFRFGVYGWAGGSWDYFDRWSFVNSGYFSGYNHGYRNGYRDGYWDGRRDVHRYAVPRGQGTLGRGIITTDTKPLKPSTWGKNPEEVLRGMRAKPEDLRDVTSFIARKPDLSPDIRRAVSADDAKPLDGTPLKPSTLGRKPTRAQVDDSWNNGSPGKPRVVLGDGGSPRGSSGQPTVREVPDRRPAPQADGGVAKPRVTPGERPDSSGRPTVDDSKPAVREKPSVRPSPQADGGSPRPERPSRVVIEPRPDRSGDDDRPSSGPTVRERPSRPSPESDGGSPRPERSVQPREKPRVDPPSSRDRGAESYERPSDRYERPAPQPRVYEPRVYEQPRREAEPSRPSYRPESRPEPRYEPRPESRPSPQVERERSRPSPSVRPSEPPRSSSRGESSRPQVRERSRPPRNDGRDNQ
jgi:FecR protein